MSHTQVPRKRLLRRISRKKPTYIFRTLIEATGNIWDYKHLKRPHGSYPASNIGHEKGGNCETLSSSVWRSLKVILRSCRVLLWPSTKHGCTDTHLVLWNSRNSVLNLVNLLQGRRTLMLMRRRCMATVFWDSNYLDNSGVIPLPGKWQNGHRALLT